jgi:Alpha/beta hydrolase family
MCGVQIREPEATQFANQGPIDAVNIVFCDVIKCVSGCNSDARAAMFSVTRRTARTLPFGSSVMAPAPPILPPQDGFPFLDRQKFAASFAADVKPGTADFMANSQVPWGLAAASGGATAAAWKTKPSWYLLTTEDHMIAPELQRFMSKRAGSKVVEIKGSHAIYVSQPQAVATLIEKAANGALLVAAR